MHFKKLEIVGFKSFLNKTKLKFEPGVTAVVGPNGCGKSNIVDAIKWVLGEQSTKSMRSSSMQDVIFNGTEKHDPVNIAEVSLTLSNADGLLPVDYDEVTISRKLFRSGESEYLLNKMPVRLADIRSILMGTGMGTSSYSIVEQGKMDMILSSKPEERRYVFEEASGITRYKTQKREALLKLERTQENLTRISDIIREVERQIKSIERQARKAERYKERYEELKKLEIKQAAKKYKSLGTNDTSLGEENSALKKLAEDLSSQLKESTESLLRRKEEFNTLSEELQGAQAEVMQLSSSIDKNAHAARMNSERVQELQRDIDRLKVEITEVDERKSGLRVRLESMEVRFGEASGKRQEKDDALQAAEENIRVLNEKLENFRSELKLAREKTVDVVSEETKAKNAFIKANADIQNAQAREKRLKLERNNVQMEKETVTSELKLLEEKAASSEKEFEIKRKEFTLFSAEYNERQEKKSLLSAERIEKEKRLNEIRPRRQFFEKLLEEREGITESVKEIMSRAEKGDARFQGVHGILSELVNVEEDYEESVTSLLGDAAQSLVVEDRGVSERVISFLKENSMESVNLIILDELRKFFESAPLNASNSALNGITQVLAANEPYSSALKALLSDTFIAPSGEEARKFLDENSAFNGSIISKKGEVSKRGLRRSRNYSEKEVIPLFGRREKVKEMRREEESISSEIEKITAGVQELEAWLKESSAKKEYLERELRTKEMEFASISSKKTSVKEKADSLDDELVLLNAEIEEEASSIKELQDERDRLSNTLEEMAKEAARLQEISERSQEGILETSRMREETLFCMADIKAELSALRKEEENLLENLEREKDSCQRAEKAVLEKESRINENTSRIGSLQDQTRRLEESNLEDSALVEARNNEICGKREKKESLAQNIREEEEKLKIKEERLEEARNRARDLDIQGKELEYRKDAIKVKILDTYKVDITTLSVEEDASVNWEEVSSRVEELKSQMEKMGEVSLGAVEEHKELEERFQFLTRQRDDLVKGRETLMQAIAKINRTTRQKFMESFEAIKKEFNDYFKMLFNGGKAELVLEDESNVLECGIDIIVRPPGKKLHNIMQLSGGEKSMTAIALIFAIFKVNPSPFCILDEIDAPLDESNIVRFCRVLQDFIKLSQFIIVTHNRMTIQLADVLYGITMEEKGVSKIVSVKFSEEKEMPDVETVPSSV